MQALFRAAPGTAAATATGTTAAPRLDPGSEGAAP
jgi:hypothetical protein